MPPDEFIERVRDGANLESQADARELATATLETLGERIGDSQAEKLAAGLPEDFAAPLLEATPDEAESFGLDEFLDRVGDRAEIAETDPLVGVRAVFDALEATADEGELADAREQLPGEFDLAFDSGEFLTADEFLAAVQDGSGLDSGAAAEAATTAALETLGERLSEGETEDLATYLPEEFGRTLADPSGKEPSEFGVEEFVSRVAEKEGVEGSAAESHARAVLGVLSDAVGDRESRKARSQLPDEYDALFDDGGGTGGDST